MRRYDKIKEFNVCDMADFIFTIIDVTEQEMLGKLAEYGLEVSLVSLDPSIRKAKIIDDLLVEDDDATDT